MKKGQKMSKEQKAKIALAHKGMKATEEAKLKMSLAKAGKPSWNKGKPSPWAGANGFKKGVSSWNKNLKCPAISEKMKGNTYGRANKDRFFSKETLLKMSLAKKGKPSSFKGKKHSKEVKEKMNLARIKYVNSLTKSQTDFLKIRNRLGQIKRYKKINPNYVIQGRNARIVNNGGFHSEKEWNELKEKYNLTCPCCLKKEPEIKLTKDHILPLLKGGMNNIENIQPLCMLCNSKKHIQIIKY
jgi:5-methylcytosine-specific restriction endonuclease McrA